MSSICQLDRLADVELQLTMHNLDAKDLLRLARCNHRLYQVADSSFAWRYSILCLSMTFDFQRQTLLSFHSPSSHSRLLHHASIGLSCKFWHDGVVSVAVVGQMIMAPFLDALQSAGISTTHFIELNISNPTTDIRFDENFWDHLLIRPEFQHLTSLNMQTPEEGGSEASEATMRILTKLPQLKTLYVPARRPKDAGLERIFADMPSLTELHLEDNAENPEGDSCLPLIAQCKHLTLLNVRCPAIRGNMFRQLFAESNLRTLKSLQLTNFNSSSVSPADYIATFTAMTHLQSLHLHSLSAVRLMAYLCHAPGLQCFTLQLAPLFMSTQATWMPSTINSFADMMIACRPSLHCTLIFKSNVRRLHPQLAAAMEQTKLLIASSKEMQRLKQKVQARFQLVY